uniref:uncharacterized protein LOC120329502 n=1 Tax=Styela clava TaxID=7725 RepID=UPI001939EB55|nr:uncharacterized protein LOC120329502 [Styela clava]
MKILLLSLLFCQFVYGFAQKEFNSMEFKAMFDKKVNEEEISKFTFPEEDGYVAGKHNSCGRLKLFSGPEDRCFASKGDTSGSPNACEDQKCTQKSVYGSSKCRSHVRLRRPYRHTGVECTFHQKACENQHDNREMYPEPEEETKERHMYPAPEPGDAKSIGPRPCLCQTIWCMNDIYTIYEKDGDCYKGNVTIKTPCGCECRKKNIMFEWGFVSNV